MAQTTQLKKRTFDDPLEQQILESLQAIKEGRIYRVTRTIDPKTGKVHVVKERAEW